MIAFGSEDTIFLGSLAPYCSIHDVYEFVRSWNVVLKCLLMRLCDCALVEMGTTLLLRALNHRFIPARFSAAPVFTITISSMIASPILPASILHPHDQSGFAGSTGDCVYISQSVSRTSTRRMQRYIPLPDNMPSP